METGIVFYLVAAVAVVFTGISKGGFGGIALLAVPLLTLVMPATTAAAVMLPLLLAMDALGIWEYRKDASWMHLKKLLPGALIGIAIGTITAAYVNDQIIQFIVGTIAVAFVLYKWFPRKNPPAQTQGPTNTGVLWGGFAGYTSFIAHAGSPPFHVYILPKKLSPRILTATSVWFFAVVNLVKLPAYFLAAQINMETLTVSAALLPIVPIGFFLGVWLNKHIQEDVFYKVIYIATFLIGLKLMLSTFL